MFGIMRERSFAHYKILMGEDFSGRAIGGR